MQHSKAYQRVSEQHHSWIPADDEYVQSRRIRGAEPLAALSGESTAGLHQRRCESSLMQAADHESSMSFGRLATTATLPI